MSEFPATFPLFRKGVITPINHKGETMKIEKLVLDQLVIKSFVTGLDQNQLKGGLVCNSCDPETVLPAVCRATVFPDC